MPGWGGATCKSGGKGAVCLAAGGGEGVKSLLYTFAPIPWRISTVVPYASRVLETWLLQTEGCRRYEDDTGCQGLSIKECRMSQ